MLKWPSVSARSGKTRGPHEEGDQRDRLTLISAIHWTPALHDEVFSDIRSWLSHAFVDDQDPCLLFIHLASPGVSFTDRGKGM